MKRILKNIIVLISLTSIFFVACADMETPQHEVTLFQSMNNWMKANRPDVPMIDSGLYYQIYDKNGLELVDDNGNMAPYPEGTITAGDTSIVEILINAQALDGNIFLNSNEILARKLGNFRYTTRYVPFRYQAGLYSQYNFTNIGVNSVIKKMLVGDSAVIFLSPNNSYGYIEVPIAQYPGFEGSAAYSNGLIGQYNVVLKKIESDPDFTVLKQTEQYAVDVLGLIARDSVKEGLYLKRTDTLDFGEFLGDKDTTVQIKYKGYFFDNFVFDTNMEEVARANKIYNAANAYGTISFRNKGADVEDEENEVSYVEAWDSCIRKMKPGDKATILTIPEWGFGTSGSYGGNTIIPGMTPVVFEIEILITE